MTDQAKAITSINKRIKVRKQEVTAAKKNIAELDALLLTPDLGSDNERFEREKTATVKENLTAGKNNTK